MSEVWARDLQERGALSPAAIVATSMSNLGLERALSRHGIDVVRIAEYYVKEWSAAPIEVK